ncbi:uncharacterized protein [Rutidosis leptorrhynchoides]|uniref:uncharacterized protein n=1 Tax=Rutidosis leptorrhynchoides TaxID=125765 RepID=UPI003A9A0579
MRCVGPAETEMTIEEVHSGSCALHSGYKTIASKIMRMGYFWPTLYRDVTKIVKGAKVVKGAGNVKFLIVAIDYFTKWMEAKALRTITGVQIAKEPFKSWCEELNIMQKVTSVAHPQANWLCEVTNRDIKSTGKTPFNLVYGSEAMIPAEIFVPIRRVANFVETANNDTLCENLNFLEERRSMAALKEANNKQQIVKYYNKKVRALAFDVGE